MKLYAEMPRHRLRQVAGDAAVVAWVALWTRVGMWMDTLIHRLQGPGRAIEGAGAGFADNLRSIGAEIRDVPLVGDELQTPFDAAARAGTTLRDAGQGYQDVVHSIALWTGVLFAVIPIVLVLMRYVPARARWVRDATAAARMRVDADDLRLFALRAAATRPLHELRRASPHPGRALATEDYRALAALELGALGLKTPEPAR